MTSVRKQTRPPRRWKEAAASATAPDDLMAVAYDRLRRDLSWLRRPQRDPLARASDTARAERLAAGAAAYLTSQSEQAEGDDRG
jgi:hypothetical protein